MKKWITSENGVPFSGEGDCTNALLELIERMQDGDELIFAKGTYYIKDQVLVKNRKGLKFRGYGSVIMSEYDKCHPNDCKTPLEFHNCDDFEITGITMTTTNLTNIYGRIIAKDKEKGWFDVILPDDTYVSGNEWIEGLDTCNEDLSVNFHIGWADMGTPHRYYKINRNTIRFLVWPTKRPQLDNVHIGEIICMRYSLYAPGNFCCIGCNNFLFEDITIEACPGESCVIYPSSSNFTFRRYNVKLPIGSKQAIACNTDGIHIVGMRGKLILEDCHFEYMGDDSLNIHAQCGNIYAVHGNTVESGILKYNKTIDEPPAESLSPDYAKKGDIIYIYDSDSKIKKGEMTVDAYEKNRFTVSEIKGEYKRGDILVNSAYYPETVIKNCSISRSRARGLLIQTDGVTVENCHFEKTAGAAIFTVVGIGFWNEMGPACNMVIKNCTFEGCRTSYVPEKAAGIAIGHNDNRNVPDNETGVFNNISILGNKFYNLNDPAIYASGVKGLEIKNNEFFNCGDKEEHSKFEYDIVAHSCEDISVCENTSDSGKLIFEESI